MANDENNSVEHGCMVVFLTLVFGFFLMAIFSCVDYVVEQVLQRNPAKWHLFWYRFVYYFGLCWFVLMPVWLYIIWYEVSGSMK